MSVFTISDLKIRIDEILDAAMDEPQFIFRSGRFFMVASIERSRMRALPEGYFAKAYKNYPQGRSALEAATAEVRQTPER